MCQEMHDAAEHLRGRLVSSDEAEKSSQALSVDVIICSPISHDFKVLLRAPCGTLDLRCCTVMK